MAARTHSTVSKQSLGNLTLSVIKFDDIDTADTYDSYIPSAVAYWANRTDTPTQTRETIGVAYTMQVAGVDIGRFTFNPSEDNCAVTLYVLSRT